MSQLTTSELRVWRRIASLVGSLGPPVAEGYERSVLTTVVPTLDYLQMDCEAAFFTGNMDIQASAGGFVIARTVPVDRTYRLTQTRLNTTSGNRGLAVSDGTTHHQLTANGTADRSELLDVWVPPGWSIGSTTTGNAGDSSRSMTFSYQDFPSPRYGTQT